MDYTTRLIRNALIVTMDPDRRVFQGDIRIENDRITEIGPNLTYSAGEVFNAEGMIAVPGLIQTHVHLCQTLFRNMADDMELLDWLKKRIWPYEAAHTPESLRSSARLGIAELLLSGTTTILDMGTVHHMDSVFEELERSGIRAFCGKTMMDQGEIPDGLYETTEDAISSSVRLMERWHGTANGRIKYAFAPRFVISCTEELLTRTAAIAKEHGLLFHTHASENQGEIELVEEIYHKRNIVFLKDIGVTSPNVCLAHCIWLDEQEKQILESDDIKVVHCPGSNLKLASGLAPIPEYIDRGICVSLGADGAPCNNNLGMFNEMRLAGLIHKPHYGATAMNAETVFTMATLEGARALGMQDEIGSLEVNKKADITLIKSDKVHAIPFENIYSKLVYATTAADVSDVMVDGQWLVLNRELVNDDLNDIIASAKKEIENILN